MSSPEYKQLVARIEYLTKVFVPPRSKEQTYWGQDKLRAYRLLAHAEIEYYVEQVCEKLLTELENALYERGQARKMEKIWGEKHLSKQRNAIGENHGIKKSNINTLFEPLGISEQDIDQAAPQLLDRMDQLGKVRGHDAHKGVHHRATKTLNGTGVRSHIKEIVDGLEALDKMIAAIRIRQFFDR